MSSLNWDFKLKDREMKMLEDRNVLPATMEKKMQKCLDGTKAGLDQADRAFKNLKPESSEAKNAKAKLMSAIRVPWLTL